VAEDSMDRREQPGQPGVAVDARGGTVIDPSKNVEDLVEAKAGATRDLRAADLRFADAQFTALEKQAGLARQHDSRFQDYAREAEAKLQAQRTDAETRRIDQLAQTRQEFQNTIRDMLAESVRTTSTLVSTQLVQIQATFDTRVSKLEAQAFTAAGRSSVNDPAIESAMARMSQGIASLSTQTAESMNKMASINAESMSKIAATVAAMQSSAATAAGEQLGTGAATSAQTRMAAFDLLKAQSGHSNTQIIVSIAVGVVAALGLILSIFVAMRSAAPTPPPVYQVAPAAPPHTPMLYQSTHLYSWSGY
jgi:hypothetical protein